MTLKNETTRLHVTKCGALFGKPGGILLGLVFSLACLTTSVGLISSCSQYFTTLD
ncbi:hypothetical protein C0R09_12745 [Brevibacillus laterosporus]|nr:branched-chain amino acid transport system II carrier protein [Brevibacillus laterosporus]AUM65321.1 hypothetical protein C0R09_12745 [Brevibacillus laterosporus]